jgi:hypothetical protein
VVPPLPDLSTTLPTSVPAADGSFSVNSYNGLLATIAGDYGTNAIVTPGSGISSGAIFKSLDGAALTQAGGGIAELDALLLSLYNSAQLSPTAFVMNGGLSTSLSSAVLGSPGAVTYLNNDRSRIGSVAGGTVAQYVNKAAGGQLIDIVVDPHFPAGSIVAITERIPYPEAGIGNTFEARTQRDVSQFDYASVLTPGANGGPADIFDVSSIETFINRAPVACAWLQNVAGG